VKHLCQWVAWCRNAATTRRLWLGDPPFTIGARLLHVCAEHDGPASW
jgi:hypothetical protein